MNQFSRASANFILEEITPRKKYINLVGQLESSATHIDYAV